MEVEVEVEVDISVKFAYTGFQKFSDLCIFYMNIRQRQYFSSNKNNFLKKIRTCLRT